MIEYLKCIDCETVSESAKLPRDHAIGNLLLLEAYCPICGCKEFEEVDPPAMPEESA